VFAANGASFENLGDEEKAQVLEALDAMSRHPKKRPTQTIRPANKLQNLPTSQSMRLIRKPKPSGRKKLRQSARNHDRDRWGWRGKGIRRR